jgi:hypothetical protein
VRLQRIGGNRAVRQLLQRPTTVGGGAAVQFRKRCSHPTQAADMLALQQLVGNRRVTRLLRGRTRDSRSVPALVSVQRKVEKWHNAETKKDFDVRIGEGEHTVEADEKLGALESAQRFFFPAGKQYGRANYEHKTWGTYYTKYVQEQRNFTDDDKKKSSMVLHTIFAVPEEGSGLGSLLMHYLAEDAIERRATEIVIEDPAPSAVSFYERMGAKPGDDAAVPGNEKIFEEKGRDHYKKEIIKSAAERQHQREHYADSGYVPWEELKHEQRGELIEAQRKKLDKETQDEQDEAKAKAKGLPPPKPALDERKANTLIRGYAVSGTGAMKADPRTMSQKIDESLKNRWKPIT